MQEAGNSEWLLQLTREVRYLLSEKEAAKASARISVFTLEGAERGLQGWMVFHHRIAIVNTPDRLIDSHSNAVTSRSKSGESFLPTECRQTPEDPSIHPSNAVITLANQDKERVVA